MHKVGLIRTTGVGMSILTKATKRRIKDIYSATDQEPNPAVIG